MEPDFGFLGEEAFDLQGFDFGGLGAFEDEEPEPQVAWIPSYYLLKRLLIGLIVIGFVSFRSLKKKKVTLSGAIAGFLVGTLSIFFGYRPAVLLLSFFYSSAQFTTLKEREKAKIESSEHRKIGGQRDWRQVFANCFAPLFLSFLYFLTEKGNEDLFSVRAFLGIGRGPPSLLLIAVLAIYSCDCGDTWASELGILSRRPPMLITTFRMVPKGVNGGVSPLGLLMSLLGGLFMGFVFVITSLIMAYIWPPFSVQVYGAERTAFEDNYLINQWPLVLIGGACGFFGSLIDSYLGATLQFSGKDTKTGKIVNEPGPDVQHVNGLNILDNNTVNFLSSIATAVFGIVITPLVYQFSWVAFNAFAYPQPHMT